jgi:hypothetical protein
LKVKYEKVQNLAPLETIFLSGILAPQLTSSRKEEKMPKPISFPTYDAVVATSGGNYTSIASALSTEGTGKRIFVSDGTYSETADVVVKSDQSIHFSESGDGVEISFWTSMAAPMRP